MNEKIIALSSAESPQYKKLMSDIVQLIQQRQQFHAAITYARQQHALPTIDLEAS